MKNILFTLFAILILTSCSKDEEDWTELNSNNIIGYWSTGIEGTHKLLSFDEDGTGSFGIYINATPISLDCKISGTTLKVETGSEAGTYKKQK